MSMPPPGRHGVQTPRWIAAGLAAAAVVLVVAAVGPSAPAGVNAGAPTATATTSTTPATATTTPPLPPPEDQAADPVRTLVPSIVAVDEVLTSPSDRQSIVATALTEGNNDIAVEATPGTVCAVVPVAAPVMAAGRWERDGEAVATAELSRRDPPGYGDCITADDVDGFDEDVYQYLVVGQSGAMSGPATLVIGAPSVSVWLLNDGDEPVCAVQASPHAADFYETYQADSELLPGEALAIRVAAVDQDVRVFDCPPDEVVRSLDFEPEAGVYVELFGGEEPLGSTPVQGGSVTSTTARPTTTG